MRENQLNIIEEIERQIEEYGCTEEDARENIADMLGVTYSDTFDIEDEQRRNAR